MLSLNLSNLLLIWKSKKCKMSDPDHSLWFLIWICTVFLGLSVQILTATTALRKIRAASWENVTHLPQRRFRSDCAFMQSDRSLRCPHEETLHPWRPTKIQIILRIHAVWSKSTLSAWRVFVSLAFQNAHSERTDRSEYSLLCFRHLAESRFLLGALHKRSKHYENTPIQIYWEFYHHKMKTFRWTFLVVFMFLLKT